ncbi:putative SOS response-associated peptidase YedK [Edaphobacter lichenicola]|uniref:Abasic site processing protein n=2 Tax=Tunturiibacter empetritectus TaxID=3069691 RepID=A0A7W8IG96_9BACT|nr:putative SOS response-associated peptidase YedK [Edaphobacter lichenicola]
MEEVDFAPGDDLRPQSMQPIIYTNEAGERQIKMMRWGFKFPDRLLFNARSEGIAQANFWKDAFLTGRGIAPGDAIFEWKKMPEGQKKPKYEITIPGQEPFGMAAVWKLWKNPKTGEREHTFAILTGDPNELVASIHDRMTTFVQPPDYEEYLAGSERLPTHLLRIMPAEEMKVTLVENTPITNTQVGLFDSQ